MPKKPLELAREQAVANVSAPEEIDRAVRLGGVKDWLITACIFVLIFSGLAWGWFGSIPVNVTGSGVFMPVDSSFVEMSARSSGAVIARDVELGRVVQKGDLLLTLKDEDLALGVASAERELALKKSTDAELTKLESAKVKLQREQAKAKLAALAKKRDELAAELTMREKSLKEQQDLLRKADVTQSALLQALQEVSTLREQVRGLSAEQLQDDLALQQSIAAVDASQQARTYEIRQLADQLKLKKQQYADATEVRASAAGVVTNIHADIGARVSTGDPLVTVVETSDNAKLDGGVHAKMCCIAYLPAKHAKAIEPGMDVEVAPSVAEKTRFGFVYGKVQSVDESISSAQDIQEVLPWGFKPMTTGSLLKVVVELEENPDTVSGYRWSSGAGYPKPIGLSTLANVAVGIEERRPLSFVLPWLKKKTGL